MRGGTEPDGEPQFQDPQVPFLQLFGLHVSLDSDTAMTVMTYQDDVLFGLRLHQQYGFEGTEWAGIHRLRSLTELPVGQVEQVGVLADEGALAEVHLRVGGRPVLLVAGELEETMAGGLLVHRLDESVLVFTDPAAVETVPWSTSRRGLARIPC